MVEDSTDNIGDMEDMCVGKRGLTTPSPPVVNKKRRVDKQVDNTEFVESDLMKSWKQVLGNPPPMGTTKVNYKQQYLKKILENRCNIRFRG